MPVLMAMLQAMILNVLVSHYIVTLKAPQIYGYISTTDIDECANRSTIDCTQQCINTPGSYECDCYDGYRATTANATQCEGRGVDKIHSCDVTYACM